MTRNTIHSATLMHRKSILSSFNVLLVLLHQDLLAIHEIVQVSKWTHEGGNMQPNIASCLIGLCFFAKIDIDNE